MKDPANSFELSGQGPTNSLNEGPIEVHPDLLSSEALSAVIESYILRDGTDYGLAEIPFETKTEQLRQQIQNGSVRIIFEKSSETVSLVTDRDFKRLTASIF